MKNANENRDAVTERQTVAEMAQERANGQRCMEMPCIRPHNALDVRYMAHEHVRRMQGGMISSASLCIHTADMQMSTRSTWAHAASHYAKALAYAVGIGHGDYAIAQRVGRVLRGSLDA